MITIVHGGQTGVDRGAHVAAIDNGWLVAGFMPRGARDEFGKIPADVARSLREHESQNYAARTEANVADAHALLVIVPDAEDPRCTPGTKKTLEIAAARRLPRLIVDPRSNAAATDVVRWIRMLSRGGAQLTLDRRGEFGIRELPSVDENLRLLVAGPRESKWSGARVETAGLLRRVGLDLREINARRTR